MSIENPARKKNLSRAVKAGSVITIGALLLGSAGSLAGWSQTVKGQDVSISAATFSVTLEGGQDVFDTSSEEAGVKIDPETFRAIPGDVLRTTQKLTVTADGTNANAVLTSAGASAVGDVPLEVTTTLVNGEVGVDVDLAQADIAAAIGAGGTATMSLDAAGTKTFTAVQEIRIPETADAGALGASSVISAAAWTLSQSRTTSAWEIADPLVEQAIRTAISLDAGTPLTKAHAASLNMFTVPAGASDLTGLEAATSLSILGMMDPTDGVLNQAVGLKSVTSLILTASESVLLAPLARMEQLEAINLNGPGVTAIEAPLSGLKNLKSLSLTNTGASDLSFLDGVTSLTEVGLRNSSQITDLGPLASLQRLETLDIQGLTKVTELSPLSRLTKLTLLTAGNTGVTDWTPIAHVASVTK